MRWLRILFLLAATAMTAAPVQACPLCAEAIANSNEVDEEDNRDEFPTAMNRSIYLMLGVPYMAFGVAGWMIYRGARKNDEMLGRE